MNREVKVRIGADLRMLGWSREVTGLSCWAASIAVKAEAKALGLGVG